MSHYPPLSVILSTYLLDTTLAEHVFGMVDGQREASGWLVNWYKAHDPVDRARTVHVEATVKNILPQSLTSYEVYWEERETHLTDQSELVSRWRCVITVSINAPKTEAEVQRNRFGVYVERVTEPQMENSHD